jgi:hypothetical protein
MGNIGDLTVRVGVDDSDFKSGMSSITDRLKGFASDAFTVGKDAAAGFVTAFSTAEVVDKMFGTQIVDTVKARVGDLANSVKASFSDMGASIRTEAEAMGAQVSETVGSMATSVKASLAGMEVTAGELGAGLAAVGAGAGVAAAEIGTVGAAAATSTVAVSGLGLAAGAAAVGTAALFAAATAGAVAAGAAVYALAKNTTDMITSQAILAAQLGTSFQNVSTFQNAGGNIGAGNSLLDLFGGGNLQADLDKLSAIAGGVTSLSKAISNTFNDPSTRGGIEQIVAAFQALPDPIDRANLAVQLFGQNAAEGLALMNQRTVDAVNDANTLATGWDTATRESIQRITDFGAWVKSALLAPFDFSAMWDGLKQGVLTAIASIEEPWHTFFVQWETTFHDVVGSINNWLASHGIVIPLPSVIGGLGGMSDQQMAAIMKNATANVGTPGSPFSIPSAALQVPNQLAAVQGIIDANNAEGLSYETLTSHVSSLTTSLTAMEAKFAANSSNPALTDQNLLLADAIVKTQALIDKDQGLIDKADSTAAAIKALAGAYSTLGVTNFGPLLSGTTDDSGNTTQLSGMAAFNALASKLQGPELAQAASNLEAKLQEAFHAGAISAEQFNNDVDQIEAKLNAARDSGVDLGEKVAKAFQTPTGFTNLDGSIATVSTDFEVAQAHMQRFIDLTQQNSMAQDGTGFALLKSTMDQINVDATQFGDGLFRIQTAAYALGGAMQATFDSIGQNLDSTQKALYTAFQTSDNSIISDHEALLKRLGLTSKESLASQIADNAALQADNAATDAQKLKGQVNTNKAILASAQETTLGQEDNLKTLIALDAVRGTDATAYIEQLTQVQYNTKALADAATALGNVYVGVRKAFDDAFASLSKGIADAIVNGKSLTDVFVNVGKQIASSILDTIIKGALVPLQDELNKTGGLFDTLAKGATSALSHIPGFGGGPNANTPTFDPTGNGSEIPASGGGGLGSVFGGGSDPGGLPGVDANTPGVDLAGAGGSASSDAGGLFSSLSGVVGIAQLGVSILSGIVTGAQNAHMETLLGEMEVTTRQIANVVALNGAETIFNYTKTSWQDLQVMVGELSDLHNDNVDIMGKLDLIAGGGSSGANPVVTELHNVEDRISQVRDAIAQLISTVEKSGGMGGGGSSAPDLVDAIAKSNKMVTDAIQSGIQSGIQHAFTGSLNDPSSTGVQVGSPISKALANAPTDQAATDQFLVQQALANFQHDTGMPGQAGQVFQSPLSIIGPTAPGVDASPQEITDYAANYNKFINSSTTFDLGTVNPWTNPAMPDVNVPTPGGISQSGLNSLAGGPTDVSSVGSIIVNLTDHIDFLVAGLERLDPANKDNTYAINTLTAEIQKELQLKVNLEPYTSTNGMWGGQLPSMQQNTYTQSGFGEPYQPPAPPPIPMRVVGFSAPDFNPYPSTPVTVNALTVNALSPSAKGVGDALIQYLRSNGMKV